MATAIDFEGIRYVSRCHIHLLLQRWLPGGRIEGQEYVALNPTRPDQRPGSFKINLHTGKWADFATGDKGGDLISLAGYLFDLRQYDAALRLSEMLGVPHDRT